MKLALLLLAASLSGHLYAEALTAEQSATLDASARQQYAHSLYQLHCQGCHLPEGEGFAERGVPIIKDYMAYFLEVDGGREYLIQVPGAAFSTLDDEDLALVMNWMLENFSSEQLADDYQPYTPEEVHRLRQTRGIDVEARRQALVEAIEYTHRNDMTAEEQSP